MKTTIDREVLEQLEAVAKWHEKLAKRLSEIGGFYAHHEQHEGFAKTLRAALAAQQEPGKVEPVGEVMDKPVGEMGTLQWPRVVWRAGLFAMPPVGTKLYTEPPASAGTVPVGEAWEIPNIPGLLKYINETPILQSLLYDINMLPEQISDSTRWGYLIAIVSHYEMAVINAPKSAVPQGFVLVRHPVTEEMHISAVKVLQRAPGIDGLPQRMLDAMISAAPGAAPKPQGE